jgi:hypothetical protein
MNSLGQVSEAFEEFYRCCSHKEAQGSSRPPIEEVMPR